jgi:branched-chain amino acid transport system permease protein
MHVSEWQPIVVGALTAAALYVLLGLNVIILFRATRVINFANGQFLLLGSYVFYSAYQSGGFLVALVASVLCVAALGVAVDRLAIRRLAGAPFFVPVVVTLGLAFMLNSVIDMIWQSNDQALKSPIKLGDYQLGLGFRISLVGAITIGLSVLAIVVFVLLERYTNIGVRFRANAESPLLAALSGLRVGRITSGAWAVSSAMAVIAGLAYGYANVVDPTNVELGYVILAPTLIAGFDSVVGLAVGALFVAAVQFLSVYYFGGATNDVAVFGPLLLILIIRPTGFFGSRVVSRL